MTEIRVPAVFTYKPETLKLLREILPKRGKSNFVDQAVMKALENQKENLLVLKAMREAKKLMNEGKATMEINSSGNVEIIPTPLPPQENKVSEPLP